MAKLNIFRIDAAKKDLLVNSLNESGFDKIDTKIENGSSFSLYLFVPHGSHGVSWGWLCEAFSCDVEEVFDAPKAVLMAQKVGRPAGEVRPIYAITFGTSFFKVDRYCDKGFGFDCIKRIKFNQLNRTAVTSMGSIRSRVIASFKNAASLNPTGGESYSKIKAKIILPEGMDYLGETAEAGAALKLSMKTPSLSQIALLLEYISGLSLSAEVHKIPHFEPIKDNSLIEELEARMVEQFKAESQDIMLSEFSIVGSDEVFNRADEYQLYVRGKGKENCPELSIGVIKAFCERHEISNDKEMMNVQVTFFEDGVPRKRLRVYDLLDYMDEEQKCLLCDGIWYSFNRDYMSYLHESLSGIPVYYNSAFDVSKEVLESFRMGKIERAKREGDLRGLDEAKLKEKIDRKYYAEYAFNLMRVERDGFALYDRTLHHIGREKVELCDLMKDDAIFFVKRGNASGGLTYMVDQSLAIVDLLKNRQVPDLPNTVKRVGLWVVLQRSDHIPLHDATLNWEALNMLVLKIRIEEWRHAVRDSGFDPIIYLNYETTT